MGTMVSEADEEAAENNKEKGMTVESQLKVCPGCGSCPWDFAHLGEHRENQPDFCQDCGEKLVPRSELPRDIWKDPYVRERLKDGVPAWDIAVCRCPKCGEWGYYNEGSTFSCRFCGVTFLIGDNDEMEIARLDDTLTETTGDYHNRTP
jgi:hypothetical protein